MSKPTLQEANDLLIAFPSKDDFIQQHYAMRHDPDYGMMDNSEKLSDYWDECDELVNTANFEPPMCHFCSGTGMGAVNEISCSWCKGTGIEPHEKEEDI